MHAIVVYHTISSPPKALPGNMDVSAEKFESHLKWLAHRRERVFTLEDLLHDTNHKRRFAITFDDGYLDNLTVALPLLEKYALPATIFVATGYIGQEGFLSAENVKTLAEHPLITIGSHGVTHRHFPQLDDEEARFELIESRRRLEEITGKPVDFLAWSYGDCNRELEKMSSECGYRAAWSVWNGWNTPYSRWRVPLGRYDNLPRFIAKVSRFYFPVKRLLKPPYSVQKGKTEKYGKTHENSILQPYRQS